MSTVAIVTGTDGSESAAEAVRQAAELAGSSGVPLHLVSAYPPGADPAAGVQAVLDAAREALTGLAVEIHLHAEPGGPAEALCAVAARVGAELIVVGNKGVDTSFGRRLSIAEQVQRKAPCPVLVVDTEAYWHAVPEPEAEVSATRGRIPREWKILIVTSVAVFMAFLDVTIVNVAFPSIAADFPSTSLADLSWVLNAYNIVFAAMLGPAVRRRARPGAADRRPDHPGRRRRCADPDLARAGPPGVRAREARGGGQRLGRGRGGGGGDGAVARRRARRRGRLALGVLRQRRGGARSPPRAQAARRAHGSRDGGSARPARRRAAGRGGRGARARHRQGAGLGLDRRSRARRLDGRGRRPRRAGAALAAPPGADRRARAACHPVLRRVEHGDARPLVRVLRAAALQRPLPHRRLGLLRARRRVRRHAGAARRRRRRRAGRPADGADRPARRARARGARRGRRLPGLPRRGRRGAGLRKRMAARA